MAAARSLESGIPCHRVLVLGKKHWPCHLTNIHWGPSEIGTYRYEDMCSWYGLLSRCVMSKPDSLFKRSQDVMTVRDFYSSSYVPAWCWFMLNIFEILALQWYSSTTAKPGRHKCIASEDIIRKTTLNTISTLLSHQLSSINPTEDRRFLQGQPLNLPINKSGSPSFTALKPLDLFKPSDQVITHNVPPLIQHSIHSQSRTHLVQQGRHTRTL